MTEDEIEEHSFRSLLPSEAHRRGTMEKKSRLHEESEDDAASHISTMVSGTESHNTFKVRPQWRYFFLSNMFDFFLCSTVFLFLTLPFLLFSHTWISFSSLTNLSHTLNIYFPFLSYLNLFINLLFQSHDAHIAFSSGQDSFSQFTMDMVRQYMKDEEVRLQHQSSLLHLRQKALKEKTRTELAWLELQKKRLRDKGEDDKMPPIRKKQRGLLIKLQQEQVLLGGNGGKKESH